MAVFRPFRAFRPAKRNQKLIPALPYDVMNSAEAKEMVKGNDLSFLHVDKAEIDLDDSIDIYDERVYQKAAENLKKLENSGALIQDENPCIYIYKQVMSGRAQIGLVGCTSIDDYTNNIIKKHENTLAKKEADRIKHVDTCDANTGPIFLTYKSSHTINMIVSTWISEHEPVYDFETDDEIRNTVWIIDDNSIIAKIQAKFEMINSLYIADGHHRCASAVRVGEMRRKANPNYTGNEEFNFFLSVAFPDKELEIMDYNRVVKDLNGYSKDQFLKLVSEKFEVSVADDRVKPTEKHTFGMFIDKDWYLLKAKKEFINENDPVERLDVSILQNNLLTPILAIGDPRTDKRIDFIGGIRGLKELEKRAKTDMQLAFSMYPTTTEDLMAIADAGAIMPPKSTWFEPKLLSGLFIHHIS